MWSVRNQEGKTKRTSRLRIFIWAFAISAIAGAIALPEPLEDIYRGARNYIRARPADQSIVVVAIDDKTIRELGSLQFSRSNDAKLVDALFANGAKRVFYDKVFADLGDEAGDQQFAAALDRHYNRVFLGTMFLRDRMTGTSELLLPAAPFRSHAQVRSTNGTSTAFSLSAELYYSNTVNGRNFRGIASEIAGKTGDADTRFRPDWSIQVASIPTVSYIDIINNTPAASKIRGRNVVVAITTQQSPDWLHIFGQDWLPGVYVHVVGAQTLSEGSPKDVGFIPPLLIASISAALFLRTRSRRKALVLASGFFAMGIVLPFVCDRFLISAQFLPAYFMFGTCVARSLAQRQLSNARLHNAGTLLPNLAALREEPHANDRPIIAMRIRNYAAIGASFNDAVEDDLISEIVRRLAIPGIGTTFYQAEDVLYWLGPRLSSEELSGHIEGLARLIESQFVLRGRKVDVYLAFGIDLDLSRHIANRIGRALLAADNAAANQKLMMFNTSANDEDSAWELSLMSELDAAIDAGDIWIAYQPQFDLRDDRICGAEALVRWQHPTRGAISPEAFILPAEAHNRISRLTFHILEEATTSALAIVTAHPGFQLSVNLSANLLQQSGLPGLISAVLAKSNFPAGRLTLEVTESAPFKEHDMVRANLNGIADLGIQLSIDDYGTGNATLEYLRSVPCQEIKIDRRFVGGMTTNPSDLLLVESTIELAHGLGRRVIAEGIEDPETLSRLRAIGCDAAQGYFMAKPMRLPALAKLLASRTNARAA